MPAIAKAAKAETSAKPRSAGALGRVGRDRRRRAAVVLKVWDHIHALGLQDLADRRTIVADDKLRAVFGKD